MGKKLLIKAQNLKMKGLINEAINIYNQVISNNPQNFQAYQQLGDIFFNSKRLQDAIIQYQKVIELRHDLTYPYFKLGQIYRQQKQWIRAISYYEKAIDLDHQNSLFYQVIGECHFQQQKFDKAEIAFQKVIELQSNSQDAYFQLGIVHECQGQLDKAITLFQTLLELNPSHFEANQHLGNIYFKKKLYKNALAHYQKVRNTDFFQIPISLKISETLSFLEHFDDATSLLIELLDKKLSKHYNYRIYKQLGHLERKKGNKEKSLQWFQSAKTYTESSSEQRMIQLLIGEDLRDLNFFDEAYDTLSKLLQEYPEDIPIKMALCITFIRDHRFSEAIELCQDILNFDQQNVDAYVKLAQVLHDSKQTKKAISLLEKAPNNVHKSFKIQQKLGEIYRSQYDMRKADKYFKKILDADPTNIEAIIETCKILIHSGAFDDARRQLQQALKYSPQNLKVLLNMGELEQKNQKLGRAIAFYQKAWDLYPDRLDAPIKIFQSLIFCNQLNQAEELLAQLLQQFSEEWQIIMQAGYLERWKGKRKKALEQFRQAEKLARISDQAEKSQIEAITELRALGQLEDAQHAIDILLEQNEYNIRGKLHLGGILQQKADLEAAADVYDYILKKEPKHLQARLELAQTLSQSGRINKAIALLVDTNETLGPNLQALMQLGQLAIASEDLDTASRWYGEAYKIYPFNPHVLAAMANIMVLQGKIGEGLALLRQAEKEIPHSVDIPLKFIQVRGQIGYIEESIEKINQLQPRFPHYSPLHFQLAHLYIQAGEFKQAKSILSNIPGDSISQYKKIERLRGEIALHQYAYIQAEQHFRAVLDDVPDLHDRNRLAITLMACGKLDEASEQLKRATKELGFKSSPGKVPVPLISHPAKIIQAFQINPFLLKQLTQAQSEIGVERLLVLAQVIVQDPNYFGANLTLIQELRHQGIFTKLQAFLPTTPSCLSSIPKRIIQYWDEIESPKEVQVICQTWQDQNPDYDYQRFSYEDVLTFLSQHYSDDDRVLTAFRNCDQPATQADFFRLAYLNKMGGFYADADDRCRKPLDSLLERNPELIVLQEDFGCIGNNFIGCIPGQTAIRVAFYRAVTNLLHYSADGPWFQTGPGLVTCALCSTLLSYISYDDYCLWPRIWVLSQAELRAIVTQHISLPYKRTEKSWSYSAYQRRVSNTTRK